MSRVSKRAYLQKPRSECPFSDSWHYLNLPKQSCDFYENFTMATGANSDGKRGRESDDRFDIRLWNLFTYQEWAWQFPPIEW
jgi:hypothetical protein